jgi:hypothetical protein
MNKTKKLRGGIIRNEKRYSLIIRRKDLGEIIHLEKMEPKCE